MSLSIKASIDKGKESKLALSEEWEGMEDYSMFMVKVYDLNGHQVFSSGTIQENELIDIGFLPSDFMYLRFFTMERAVL